MRDRLRRTTPSHGPCLLNLSDDEIIKLEVPDLFSSWPMTEWIKQIDYLKETYGKVLGDINTTGIQNLALKIRGDELYIDYFENPELCHHLLRICTECVKQLFEFNYKATGTGAVDVTPMADPKIAVIPNCTEEQISNNIYEDLPPPVRQRGRGCGQGAWFRHPPLRFGQ